MKTIEFDTHFYKKLWTLMVPIMVQNLMLALVAVADAFMLGGLDQNYMSAVSLATQIQFIQNMFLSAATAGLAILGAQYWGKQDIKALDDIFALAIRICGIVSVLFFVACAFFPRYLMLIFTNEPVLIDYGVSYLKIASFSYLLTGFSQCYIVMMKISEHFADEDKCLGLITGESIGQVASQTMQSLAATNEVCHMPVYRPLIAMDKNDIIDISNKIDTYETSILPYEDCCTIFVAKHPVTKPNINRIKKSEERLNDVIDELMKTAIDTTEVIMVDAE